MAGQPPSPNGGPPATISRTPPNRIAKVETWYEAVDVIQPHVVRLSTPRGQGTGFLVSICGDLCAIATAAHVVGHAHYWEEPIRADHVSSGKTRLVRHPERALFLDAEHDTAALLIARGDMPFPEYVLPLAPKDKFLRVGFDIGWLGFPAVEVTRACFFGGRVSAWNDDTNAYLVDGVAINGVSGGPAFHLADELPIIMGVVSAYMPNRATGEVLPGLSVIRDVTQFHELAPTFESITQAKAQESPATPPQTPPADAGDKVDTRR